MYESMKKKIALIIGERRIFVKVYIVDRKKFSLL